MEWSARYILLDLAAFLTGILVIVYLYFKYSFQYWAKRGIPYIKPIFPYGNSKYTLTVQKHPSQLHMKWYNMMKEQGEKHMGFYLLYKPVYLVVDIEFVKNILTRDFQHFHDRGLYSNEADDPLSAHLFTLTGLKWKNLRNKLSVNFTSGKLKKMFQTLVDCSDNLQWCLNDSTSKGEPVDIHYILTKFTVDVIGSVAFGIECNSFQNTDNEFYRVSSRIFKLAPLERFKIFFSLLLPRVAEFFKLRITNKELESFYMNLVKETIGYREKNNVQRNDFMQLLIQLKNNGVLENEKSNGDGVKLTFNEVVAQAFFFFIAGYETSSKTMAFALYELSTNVHIQEKVREEIVNVLKKYDGKVTYESIIEMHYLERIIQETLRLHPPVAFQTRVCTKDYHVPDTNYVMEKNTLVMIPIYAIHNDPDYYPQPNKFDPDRFKEENKATRPDYTYLPFGESPRICLGLRFGMMQSKVGLCRLLTNYRFKLSSKTQVPLKMNPVSFIMSAIGGIWLDAERLN